MGNINKGFGSLGFIVYFRDEEKPEIFMLQFEWDEEKNKLNQKKHKIAFEDALDIFNDKDRLEYVSNKNGEKRFLTIGKAFQALISVVYTTRKFVIRLISARRSGKDERRNYLTHKFNKNDNDK